MNKSEFIIINNGEHLVGLQDKNGLEILPCIYDKIPDYDDDGYIRFIKNGIYGTIDLQGNIMIPHTLGLTHLGVFYKDVARAELNGKWGLVDIYGGEVVPFKYKSISAHYRNGYSATTIDGVKGFLSEDGKTFTISKKETNYRFQKIAAYRNGVAPAVTSKGKWVFIDKEKNRINDIEYWSMDHVLRNGIYSVANGPNEYSIARYDGTRIIDEWYDYPVKFEKGKAVCHKKRIDKNGKEIKLINGQPAYYYGILNEDGSYLFPLKYSSIHWNDYDQKDCWYAEDEDGHYILFPNGTRRKYKASIVENLHGHGLAFIPNHRINDYITDKPKVDSPEIEEILSIHPEVFDYSGFTYKLMYWTGEYQHAPLKIYYRDTDEIVDTKKQYKVGEIIRAGDYFEATEKLKRPVCKTRFLIASRHLASVEGINSFKRDITYSKSFREHIIHKNACFQVLDIFVYCGVTQILLLHLPYGAIKLANKFDLNLSKLKPLVENGLDLKTFARLDLQDKMNKSIHGYSLNDYWTDAMRHPLGLNSENKIIPLFPLDKSYKYQSQEEYDMGELIALLSDDRLSDWQVQFFHHHQRNTLKLVIGDIKTFEVDAIVNFTHSSSLDQIESCTDIHLAAGKELADECKSLGLCGIGDSRITNAYNLPCNKIIHSVCPVYRGGIYDEIDRLYSCYNSAIKLAIEKEIESIAFPCIDTKMYVFPNELSINIAVEVILEYLNSGDYAGDIIICCSNNKDAEIYKTAMQNYSIHENK